MTGTSLAEINPDRWAMLQRMAQAFCGSDLVPAQLKGSAANCTVALLLAEQMNESPLMVMQNIFFVGGRAGWIAQYMVSRANRSGRFDGPLRWRSEGSGDDLAVTCFADLAGVKKDPGVEITVTMKMAKADGWTRNAKYQSIPEQMLRWRSATWLIRLYAPEVMFGLPTADEIEDMAGMIDVTPPRAPTAETYKPGQSRQAPPAPVIDAYPPASEATAEPAGEPLAPEPPLEPAPASPPPEGSDAAGDREIRPPRLYGQNDYRAWRVAFDRAAKACRDRAELAMLIGENDNPITAYNTAFPKLAPAFAAARTKRMEELPDA